MRQIFEASSRSALALALLGTITLLQGCTCGSEREGVGRAPVTTPPGDLPRQLEPLPEAPALDIAQEAMAAGELTVVAARPQGEMRGELRPTITFSRPVKTLEMIDTSEAPVARIEPALQGEWKWLGSASVEFVPKGLIPYATPFKVTVPRGLRALDGSTLADDYVFEFTTPRPELQESAPRNGYAWLKPEEGIKLLFNQPLQREDLVQQARFEVEGLADPIPVKLVGSGSVAEERRAAEEAAGTRRFERQSFEERGFMNRQHRYELMPTRPLPLHRAVTLRIGGAVRGEGQLTLENDVVLSFRTYGPLALTMTRMCGEGAWRCPYGPLIVYATNPIDETSLKGKAKVTGPGGPIEIDWERVGVASPHAYYDSDSTPYLVLPANYRPGQTYKVEVQGGVKDVFGQTTSAPYFGEATTHDLEPSLETGGTLAVIEASSGTRLPVQLTNLSHLDVDLWAPTGPELASVIADPYSQRFLARAPAVSELQRFTYKRNERVTHAVDLARVLEGKPTGIVALRLNSRDLPHRNEYGARVIAQITDLAAHLKIGPAKSLVWVTRLSNGLPVEGAAVEVFDRSGKSLWKGTTDASGFADVPGAVALGVGSAAYAWEYPFLMVLASLGDDRCVTANTWQSGVGPYDFGVEAGWEGERPLSQGVVFTDRGIYRPGDRVFLKGILRFRTVGALTAPTEGSAFELKVTDSRGEKVLTTTVKTTKYGTFHAEAELPKEAPTGYFQVAVSGAAPTGPLEFATNFRVEEYRAPQFKVDVEVAKKDLIAGDALEGTVFARYLFGGAMNDAAVKWSAHSQTVDFTPPGANGFTFGPETWWWDDGEPQPSGGFFASGTGNVDPRGAFAVKAGQVQAAGDKTYRYTVEAEVTDVNRQTVAGRASVTVHPAAFYVGLRGPTGFPETNTEFGVEAIAVDTAGKRVTGRALELVLQRREWKSVRQKDAGGGYMTVSEPVETEVHKCALKSESNSVFCKYKAKEPGFYIARATIADDQGRKHVATRGIYVVGAGWVSWQRDDTERIDLLPDKTTYDVGDVAKVLIKSPYPEALALLTVEREGVLDRRQVKLVGSVRTVEVPITEEMVPNVFFSVLMVRPRVAEGGIESGDDPGRPAVRVGLTKLAVERKTRRLAVDVKTDRPDYRPGDEVTVDVAVTDHAGKAAPSEVTLYVVDEAVLRLTNYQVPDPIAAIYPDRPLSVRLGEPLLHLVRRRHFGEKGEDQGGGGGDGEGGGFRSNFQTTVIFNPTLETDAAGRARARFKLPDNLTTFRVMAVAVTPLERFGSGDSSFRVNKPLLALPALPRFARMGDRFEAGVVVHSYGAGSGPVTVTASAEGARLDGPAELRADVAEGAPRELRFTFVAEKPGVATFRFRASRGGDSDGLLQKIPIELPISPEAVATYGDTQDQRVEGIVPPGGVYPDVGGLEVTLASTALGNFQQGMRQLVDYPYGCLEQQASRLIPFVALRELGSTFNLPWAGPDAKKQEQLAELNQFLRTFLGDALDASKLSDPDAVIRATVTSILQLQNGDGSFRYWPSSYCTSSWASAWATLALHRARQVGYAVEAERMQSATAFLSRVAGGQCAPCEWGCPLETRVMAAYVLARTGSPKPSFYGEFFNKRKELPLFSQALLADAMFLGGGDRTQARKLLQEILNHAKESPKGIHFEEVHAQTYATLWHSDTRTTGAVLQTLTDLQPDHPFVSKIAHHLTDVRRGDGTWRSTQEAAFSLMGLVEVVRTKEKDVPDFTARVTLAGSPLVEEKFAGRSMEVRKKSVSIGELAQKAQKDAKLVFAKQGPGVLYYSALLKYAPRELPTQPLDHGLFVQRWFEPYEGGGQAKKFYAGDLVRVRVRVGTNQERHWTAFEVPLPAGLEPVDTSLATTASQTMTADEEGPGGDYAYEGDEDQSGGSAYEDESERNPWAYAFWSPFNHVEKRDSRVVLFADHLPPGVHVASFVARATTPGTFILKPARGELMYEPEVFGRSEGGTFEVVLPPQVSQR